MRHFQWRTPMYAVEDTRGQGQVGINVRDDGRLEITVMPAPYCLASVAVLPDGDRERLRRFLNGDDRE